MAQWWEQSPPTNVACVQFPPGVIYGLSVLLVLVLAPRVFLWVLWFPPSTKTNTPTSNSTRIEADVASSLNIAIHFFYFLKLDTDLGAAQAFFDP